MAVPGLPDNGGLLLDNERDTRPAAGLDSAWGLLNYGREIATG
jgi:hypothetical protein